MTLAGLLYVAAIVLFVLAAILALADTTDVLETLAVISAGLAALALAGGPWATRRL